MTTVTTIQSGPSAARRPKVMRNPTIKWAGVLDTLPRISIVTPCFNHAEYVEAAILSILEQGYPNLDYVIIDGGSTDRSAGVIGSYADYLSHWESRRDAGQYHAIERGFERSDGEIMMWLNADDLLQRNALWTVAEIFRQFPQVKWLHGTPGHIDSAGRWYSPDLPPRWSRQRYLRGDFQWIQQESVCWRRELWQRAGGRLNLDYELAADMELWMRFFRHAVLHSTTASLAGFRHSNGQRSRVYSRQYMAEARRIVATEPISRSDRAALRRLWWFDRFWRRIPVVRKSWRVRRAYQSRMAYPPLIDFDHERERFAIRPEADG